MTPLKVGVLDLLQQNLEGNNFPSCLQFGSICVLKEDFGYQTVKLIPSGSTKFTKAIFSVMGL